MREGGVYNENGDTEEKLNRSQYNMQSINMDICPLLAKLVRHGTHTHTHISPARYKIKPLQSVLGKVGMAIECTWAYRV